MSLDRIIREQLDKYKRGKVISEMASSSDYCKKTFSTLGPELPFCEAAENYIKNEIETVGRAKKKVIFDKFRKGLTKFFYTGQGEEELEIKIENITDNHPLMKEGIKEIQTVKSLIQDNCPNVDRVFKKQMSKFKDEVLLYFTEEGKYSITNRLDTNYSAIAVLFTKFFQKKGAFDSTEDDIKDINWENIAKNWIDHSFNPSLPFIDIRKNEDKLDRTMKMSSLDFGELCRVYFKDVRLFNSSDVRSSVNQVLKDVRERGFASEKMFEINYLVNKTDFRRLAKDYGFADRFLGIDFIYKGKDFWIPVQVKSSPIDATYLISSLGCKTYVIAEKTGNTFKINTLHSDELSH